jgi:hypothetical protein
MVDEVTSDGRFMEDAEAMSVEELAKALGEEVPQEESTPEPEPVVETSEPEPEKFVYDFDGVRREFDSREELLSYESGRKSNEIGELRAKLEAFEKLMESSGQEPPKQLSAEEQDKRLLAHALQGTGVDINEVDAGAYKTILKMIENTLGLYDSTKVEKRFQEIQGTVEKITTQAEEARALNQYGITKDQVKDVLEKHPQLKALNRADRVAVIADLTKAGEAKKAAPETANPLRQALKPDASSHVEGSATNNDPVTEEQAIMKKASELSDRDLLKWLGEETAKGPKPWDNL